MGTMLAADVCDILPKYQISGCKRFANSVTAVNSGSPSADPSMYANCPYFPPKAAKLTKLHVNEPLLLVALAHWAAVVRIETLK